MNNPKCSDEDAKGIKVQFARDFKVISSFVTNLWKLFKGPKYMKKAWNVDIIQYKKQCSIMTFKLVNWILVISSLCIASLEGACNLKKFREKGIVPNIVPDLPTSVIKVQYTEKALDCGTELPQNVTKFQPGISFTGKNEKLHTLVMFDPDAPTPEDPRLANYRHWVVEDIPGNNFYDGYTVSSYLAPDPPVTSDAHRYIFLIYEQPTNKKLHETFDDEKRTKFKLNTFVQKRKLIGPVAGNFMYVHHL
ncbi:protein MOTHER of FT and TFL1 homolog 1 [Nephila pilipes]|uniref:Protein MOTHER of FT and TFL1 homolog 1 n=1 Tax=Nephila pilipes TaxID=299642 RepID=A0A8X6PE05_NEPPI|nr:protein MOTHER of FT and TFL1 homolog 1 [Nephila pilipes]